MADAVVERGVALPLKVERRDVFDHRIEGDSAPPFVLDAQVDNRLLYSERAFTHDNQDVKIRVATVISPHARPERVHRNDEIRERVA